jgi:transcriptional regulator with XRE-family HTH domain
METFGERLRKHRTQRSLSLDDLAAKTGLSKAYLWRLETNPDINPSIEVAQKLASGLEVTILALIAAPSIEAEGRAEIPPTLKKAQKAFGIPERDLPDLARIRFRGAQPMTAEDWGLLYLHLKKTVAKE